MTQFKPNIQPSVVSEGDIATTTVQIRSPLSANSYKNRPIESDFRLRNLCLARGLSHDGLEQLADVLGEPFQMPKKQHLYRQSDCFKSLFFVINGYLKSYVHNANGDELAVSFFMPGEIIGLDGLAANYYTSSVITLETASLCQIPYRALERQCSIQPALQKNFNELQSRQIVQELEMTILRGHRTAADRLAAFLINLSQRYERIGQSPVSFRLPMTRKEIGACLGLSLETVSRLFTLFQDEGFILADGKEVTLINFDRKDYLFN